MFPKSYRYSFRKGLPKKTLSTTFFVIKYDNSQDDSMHCAVVVGKKVDKRAVVRNKIKRQTVVLLKRMLNNANINVVVIVKKSIQDKLQQQIAEDLEHAIKKITVA